MKEKIKRFLRKNWKPLIGVFTLVVLAAGILILSNLKSKQNMVETSFDIEKDGITSEEEVKPTEVPLIEEMPQVEDTKEPTKESTESSKENTSVTATPTVEAKNSETEKPSVTKKAETKSEKETTSVEKPTEKPTEKPASQAEPTATVAPTTETKYVPISEGWKAEASAKGDITSAQKADLDSMIQTWKSGAITDAELKDKIISYLDE